MEEGKNDQEVQTIALYKTGKSVGTPSYGVRIISTDNTNVQWGRDGSSSGGDLIYREPRNVYYPWLPGYPVYPGHPFYPAQPAYIPATDWETRRAAQSAERTTQELQEQLTELREEIALLQEMTKRASGPSAQEKAALDLLLAADPEKPEEYARIVKAVKVLLGTE